MDYKTHLWEHGYAIIRGAYSAADVKTIADEMDRLKTESLQYEGSYRDRNVVFVIRPHSILGRHLRFIHWPSYISPVLAAYRVDLRQLEILEPLIGNHLKQIGNQATWKTTQTSDTSFGFHQDARFRRPASAFRELPTSYVQMFMAVDPHRVENGCLKIYPGSHKFGMVNLPTDRSVLDMESENSALQSVGLDPKRVVNILLDPGDVALWLPHTIHGSGPNLSNTDRRAYLNGYVIVDHCDRGEFAFQHGEPYELGEPVLIQYDELFTRPEPHYIEAPFIR